MNLWSLIYSRWRTEWVGMGLPFPRRFSKRVCTPTV